MRSKMSIAGHPIHPMLVSLPIGLFIWAFVADIVYVARDRDPVWYDIAFWSSIAGLITGVIAAVPGIGDYVSVVPKTEARGIATVHMSLNGIVLALYGVAAIWMRNDGATEGSRLAFVVALHAVGVVLLAVSGWLGGEMVYRKHISMIPDSDEHAREEELRHRVRPGEEGQPHIAPALEKPR